MSLLYIILAILCCLTLAIISYSTTQNRYLKPEKFMSQLQEIKQMNSAYKTTYIGSSDSRVYLEYYTAITLIGKGKTVIYWTKIEDLSSEQLKQIEDIKN